MDARMHLAAVLLVAAPVAAQDPMPSLPTVKAEAVRFVADCDRRILPSQRDVGEWTGQHNFSQVYYTRQRLMAEIGRACQRGRIEAVQVVSRDGHAPRESQVVAMQTARAKGQVAGVRRWR